VHVTVVDETHDGVDVSTAADALEDLIGLMLGRRPQYIVYLLIRCSLTLQQTKFPLQSLVVCFREIRIEHALGAAVEANGAWSFGITLYHK